MTAWQAILSTPTSPSQSLGEVKSDLDSALAGRISQSRPAFTSILRPMAAHAAAAWKWLERKRTQQLAARRLRVAETIQLGEKRFVSILQVDGVQFLIGGAAGNISLLAILNQEQAVDSTSAAATTVFVEAKR